MEQSTHLDGQSASDFGRPQNWLVLVDALASVLFYGAGLALHLAQSLLPGE